jgi:hypothetical protein
MNINFSTNTRPRASFGYVLGGVFLWIVTAIIASAIFMLLWRWHVTPLGVRAISLPEAVGLDVMVTVLIYRPSAARDKDHSLIELLIPGWIVLVLLLGVGWIAELAK